MQCTNTHVHTHTHTQDNTLSTIIDCIHTQVIEFISSSRLTVINFLALYSHKSNSLRNVYGQLNYDIDIIKHTHTYIYTHTHAHTHTRKYARTYSYLHMHTYLSAHIYECIMHTRTHAHTSTCMQTLYTVYNYA